MARGQYEQWFLNELVTGLQKLISLSLNGSPAMETIQLTAVSWAETLWAAPIGWHSELDAERIQQAFLRIMRDIERWPAPKHLLNYLPQRPQPVHPLLSAPQMSEERRMENQARVAELVAMVKGQGHRA